jgi:hypothetical protein
MFRIFLIWFKQFLSTLASAHPGSFTPAPRGAKKIRAESGLGGIGFLDII